MVQKTDTIQLLVVAGLLISGCASIMPGLFIDHQISVVNNDERQHEVNVTIQKNNAVIFNATREIGPKERWEVTKLDKEGDYHVVAEMETGNRINESFTLPLVEGDRSSFLEIIISEEQEFSKILYSEE